MSESSSLWSAGNVRPKRQQAEQNYKIIIQLHPQHRSVEFVSQVVYLFIFFVLVRALKWTAFFFLTPFFRDKVSESCFTGQLPFGMRTSDSDATTPDPAQGYATGRIVEIACARRVCLSNHAVGTSVFVHQSDSKATLA